MIAIIFVAVALVFLWGALKFAVDILILFLGCFKWLIISGVAYQKRRLHSIRMQNTIARDTRTYTASDPLQQHISTNQQISTKAAPELKTQNKTLVVASGVNNHDEESIRYAEHITALFQTSKASGQTPNDASIKKTRVRRATSWPNQLSVSSASPILPAPSRVSPSVPDSKTKQPIQKKTKTSVSEGKPKSPRNHVAIVTPTRKGRLIDLEDPED